MQNNSGKVPAGSHGDVMLEGQLHGYGAHCADIELHLILSLLIQQ